MICLCPKLCLFSKPHNRFYIDSSLNSNSKKKQYIFAPAEEDTLHCKVLAQSENKITQVFFL